MCDHFFALHELLRAGALSTQRTDGGMEVEEVEEENECVWRNEKHRKIQKKKYST